MTFWGYNNEEEARKYWPDFLFDCKDLIRKEKYRTSDGQEKETTIIEFGKEPGKHQIKW